MERSNDHNENDTSPFDFTMTVKGDVTPFSNNELFLQNPNNAFTKLMLAQYQGNNTTFNVKLCTEKDLDDDLWGKLTETQKQHLKGNNFALPLSSIAYSPDGNGLAVGNGDGRICIWSDTDNNNASPIIVPSLTNDRNHWMTIEALDFDPIKKGRIAAWSGYKIFIFRPEISRYNSYGEPREYLSTNNKTKDFKILHVKERSSSIKFDPQDSKRFFSLSYQGILKVWNLVFSRVRHDYSDGIETPVQTINLNSSFVNPIMSQITARFGPNNQINLFHKIGAFAKEHGKLAIKARALPMVYHLISLLRKNNEDIPANLMHTLLDDQVTEQEDGFRLKEASSAIVYDLVSELVNKKESVPKKIIDAILHDQIIKTSDSFAFKEGSTTLVQDLLNQLLENNETISKDILYAALEAQLYDHSRLLKPDSSEFASQLAAKLFNMHEAFPKRVAPALLKLQFIDRYDGFFMKEGASALARYLAEQLLNDREEIQTNIAHALLENQIFVQDGSLALKEGSSSFCSKLALHLIQKNEDIPHKVIFALLEDQLVDQNGSLSLKDNAHELIGSLLPILHKMQDFPKKYCRALLLYKMNELKKQAISNNNSELDHNDAQYECPICFELLSNASAFELCDTTCMNIVCKDCKKQIDSCPFCRSDLI